MIMQTNSKLELRPLNDHELRIVSGGSSERPMQRLSSFPEYAQMAFDHGVRRLESGLKVYRL
jgi:hypothetical protein